MVELLLPLTIKLINWLCKCGDTGNLLFYPMMFWVLIPSMMILTCWKNVLHWCSVMGHSDVLKRDIILYQH